MNRTNRLATFVLLPATLIASLISPIAHADSTLTLLIGNNFSTVYQFNGTTLVSNFPQSGASMNQSLVSPKAAANSSKVNNVAGVSGPVNNVAPSLSTIPGATGPVWNFVNLGLPVYVSDGTWSSTPTSISYQWYSCTNTIGTSSVSLPAGCTSIGGATSSTLNVTSSSLLGSYLSAAVTASSGGGSTTIWTGTSPQVVQLPWPTTMPSLSGVPQVGSSLTANVGVWNGFPSPSYGFRWFDCASQITIAFNGAPPSTCSVIPGANTSTYVVQSSDAGFFITSEVSGIVAIGSGWTGTPFFTPTIGAITDPNVIPGVPPVAAPASTISPSLASGWASWPNWYFIPNGDSIYLSIGSWSNSPSSYSYQWYQCVSQVLTASATLPTGCTSISGANTRTLNTGASTFLGSFLVASVTATNPIGSTTAWTASSPEIIQVPQPTTVPSLSGTAVEGSTLVANPGVWTGFPTPSLVFNWFDCSTQISVASNMAPPSTCTMISGANTSTYTLKSTDIGYYITAEVTAIFLNSGLPYFTPTTSIVQSAKSAQVQIAINNSVLINPANSSITITTSGGSGTGITSFSVAGVGCTLAGTGNNVLSTTEAGTCVVTASNPGDARYLPTYSSPVTFTFTPISQVGTVVIANTTLSAQNGSTIILAASGGSGNGIYSFTTNSTGCTISNNTVTRATTGSCAVTATKAASGIYAAASSSPSTFSFAAPNNQATLTISNATKSVTGSSTVGLTTSGGSGTGLVSFTISGGTAGSSGSGCIIVGASLSTSQAGTCIVVATKAASGIYNATSSAAVTFTFTAVTQNALTIVPSTSSGPAGTPINLASSGGSGAGSYSFSTATTGCTASTTNSNLGTGTITRSATTGTCSVTVTHAAGGIYSAITSPAVSVTFNAATQSPVSIVPASLTGTAGTAIALNSSGGQGAGAFTMASSTAGCTVATSNTTRGVGSVNRSTAPGVCTVTVTKAANGIYAAATSAAVNLTFNAATQASLSISNANTATIAKGTTGITLATTGGSGTGAVTYSVTGAGCTLVASKLTVATTVSPGANVTCSVVATKAASGIYSALVSTAKVFTFR